MTRMIWPVLLAVMACNCESGGGNGQIYSPTRTGGTTAEPRAVAEARDVSERPVPADPRERMRAHYEAATELQRAISHGQLIAARDLAAWIGANANPHTDELLTAAYQIEQAADLTTAAALTGDLAAACGSCHQERGVQPTLKLPPEPPVLPGIAAQMQRHQWAAARLWDGVIGPDDRAWFAGARTMASATIDLGATTHAKPNAEVVGLAETMHELAERAGDARGLTERSVLYGEMLQTCASCHAIVRPRAIARR